SHSSTDRESGSGAAFHFCRRGRRASHCRSIRCPSRAFQRRNDEDRAAERRNAPQRTRCASGDADRIHRCSCRAVSDRDDLSAGRNLLALRLANEGYSTDVAADGRTALESIRRDPPALIISETVLPGMDGFSLLDTLRREGRHIPLVFLSARNDALSMNKGLLL